VSKISGFNALTIFVYIFIFIALLFWYSESADFFPYQNILEFFLKFVFSSFIFIIIVNVLINSRCKLSTSPEPLSSYGTDLVTDACGVEETRGVGVTGGLVNSGHQRHPYTLSFLHAP
jgi:hypothetical protein